MKSITIQPIDDKEIRAIITREAFKTDKRKMQDVCIREKQTKGHIMRVRGYTMHVGWGAESFSCKIDLRK
jgi:hypothetical protein